MDELDKLRAENERLRQERRDALSVTSKEGLLASEWVARTGKAERERDEARAENERLQGLIDDIESESGHSAFLDDGCHEPPHLADFVRDICKERDALRAENERLRKELDVVGYTARHDAALARAQQAERERDEQCAEKNHLRTDVSVALRERDALHRDYVKVLDDRDALLRIINDSFMSLHIPQSTLAFDGRNLVAHVQEASRTAERLRQERDEARAEAIREMRAWAVQSWLEQVEAKKQYDPNTADRRECQAEANAYQSMAFKCDEVLAAIPQPAEAEPSSNGQGREAVSSSHVPAREALPEEAAAPSTPPRGEARPGERADLDAGDDARVERLTPQPAAPTDAEVVGKVDQTMEDTE